MPHDIVKLARRAGAAMSSPGAMYITIPIIMVSLLLLIMFLGLAYRRGPSYATAKPPEPPVIGPSPSMPNAPPAAHVHRSRSQYSDGDLEAGLQAAPPPYQVEPKLPEYVAATQ
ncbi:hypothetical protein PsYK624_050970 [Phanerochaete sordida]|uniref:Uncharacterized protein n=1 Tax=Phanerochaete sordida TaxID=48140 RepID=A0A9P3LCB7_9APHY|nr:hypothetical protein PsYK624_050970 [Phanerochaete sordida]